MRPHHGMCFQFYEGKGYSEEFTDHMGRIVNALNAAPQQKVTISSEMDEVCRNCPNNQDGICATSEKVARYDREVLRLCGIKEGQRMPYGTFRALVKANILEPGLREGICGDCCWNSICAKKTTP